MKLDECFEMAQSPEGDDRVEAGRQLQQFLHQERAATALAELLGDTDWRVRRAAVDSFLEAHLPQTLPLIIDALHDGRNAGKRNAALDILSRFGKEIISIAGPYLESADADIRMFFLNIFGDLGDWTHLDQIVANLNHDNRNVVSAAILALGKIGHVESCPRILKFLKGGDTWLQFQALEALGEMQELSVIPELIPLYNSTYCRKAVIKALGRFHHEDAYAALIRFAFDGETLDPDPLAALIDSYHAPQPAPLQEWEQQKIRELAATHITEPQKAALLEAADSQRSQKPVIEILSWLGYEKAIPAFINAIRRPELAETAEGGLLSLGPVAGPHLLPLLRQEIEEERLVLLLSLLDRLQASFDEETMAPLLAHKSPEIRQGAYRMLLKQPLDTELDRLLDGALDAWPSIHEGCMQAILERCRQRPFEKDDILRRMREQTSSEDAVRRAYAIEFLVLSGEGDIISFLTQAWKDAKPCVRQKAVELMGQFYCPPYQKALISALADEDATVREAAARALSRDFSTNAVNALLSSLLDESIWVRIAVYEYLTSAPGDFHLDLLLQKLQTEHPAAQAVLIRGMHGRGGAFVREILFRFLESEDPEIRKCACLALENYPAPETVDWLIYQLENDTEWAVRNAAVQVLSQLHPAKLVSLLVNRLRNDSDPSVRKEILKTLQASPLESLPPDVFNFLIDPDLSTSTYAFLIAQKDSHQAEIDAAVRWQKPAVRRILRLLSTNPI